MTGKTSEAVPSKRSAAAPKSAAQLAVVLDRRGKPLPPRQRVGGIITPQ